MFNPFRLSFFIFLAAASILLPSCANKIPKYGQNKIRTGLFSFFHKPSPDPDSKPPQKIRTYGPKIQITEFDLETTPPTDALILKPDDILKLSVWQHGDLDHVAEIQKNGCVTFPIVGEVTAAGRTLEELRQAVLAKFNDRKQAQPMTLSYDDRVKILVWRQPDLEHIAIVQPDGMISVPLIGQIEALGKNLTEIRDEITLKISKHIKDPIVSVLPESLTLKTLADPQISILPLQLSPRRVTIVGEVLFPGSHPIKDDPLALDILARAHYFDAGDLNNVVVIRNSHSQHPQFRRLKLYDYLHGRDPTQNIPLMPDDIILVPKTPIAEVGDFVNRFFTRTQPIFNWKLALDAARLGDEFPSALNQTQTKVNTRTDKLFQSRVQRQFDRSLDKRLNEKIEGSVDDFLDDELGDDFDKALDDAINSNLKHNTDQFFGENLDFLLESSLEEQLNGLFGEESQ